MGKTLTIVIVVSVIIAIVICVLILWFCKFKKRHDETVKHEFRQEEIIVEHNPGPVEPIVSKQMVPIVDPQA